MTNPYGPVARLRMLSAAAKDPDIGKADVAVLAVLLERLSSITGKAWPSVNQIAIDAGFSRATATRAVASLRKHGYVVYDSGSKVKKKANEYAIGWLKLESSSRLKVEPSDGSRLSHVDGSNRAIPDGSGLSLQPEDQKQPASNAGGKLSSSTAERVRISEVIQLWNERIERDDQMFWVQHQITTKAETRAFSKLLDEEPRMRSLTSWRHLIDACADTAYFNGQRVKRSGETFRLKLPWLFRLENLKDVIEGSIEGFDPDAKTSKTAKLYNALGEFRRRLEDDGPTHGLPEFKSRPRA